MISDNQSICPKCGGQLKYYDHVQRLVRTKFGNKKWVAIRRLRCCKCHAVHRELPDFINRASKVGIWPESKIHSTSQWKCQDFLPKVLPFSFKLCYTIRATQSNMFKSFRENCFGKKCFLSLLISFVPLRLD